MLPLFECMSHSLLLSMDEIKLFTIVNRIFHEPDFLKLLIMSFYGLILLRYPSTDSVLFLLPLRLYSL